MAIKLDRQRASFASAGLRGGLLVLVLLSAFSAGALAQSALEGLATQRISQETGIPEQFVRALFIDESDAQFILAFIYINDQAVHSKLRPEIIAAITPYVNRNALLVLVVPARQSSFDPLSIFLVQSLFRVSLNPNMIVPITPDFQAGTLEQGSVSAGILALDAAVLVTQPFEVHYGTHSTGFALGADTQGQAGGLGLQLGLGPVGGVLRFFLLNLLLLFLFPFLLGI